MASADQRVAELRLRFKTEKQSLEATKRDLNSFQQSFDQFKVESEKTNRALEQQVRILQAEKAAASDSRKAIADFAKEQRAAANEADKTTQAVKRQNAELKNSPTDSRNQILSQLGTELRNLPALQLPGVGFSTETVARVFQSLGKLSKEGGLPTFAESLDLVKAKAVDAYKAIGVGPIALVGSIAAFAIVLGELQRRFEEGKKAALESLDAESRLELLRTTGTQGDVDAARQSAISRREEALAAIRAAEATQERIKALVGEEEFTRVKLRASLDVGEDPNAQAFKAAQETIDKFVPIADTATREIIGLNSVYEDSGVVARTVADEEKKLADQREKAANTLAQGQLSAELEAMRLSADAIRQRVASITAERGVLSQYLAANKLTGEAAQEARDRLLLLGEQVAAFRDALPAAEEAQRQKDTVEAVKQFNADVLAETQRRAQQEAAIYDRLNTSIIKAAEQAADAVEKTLQSLKERRADLGTDLGRDERDANRKAEFERLNDQIKAQEDEAKSYRDHLRSLRQIREDSQAQEFDLVLNRDFAGLRRLRQDTARRLQEESRSFTEQKSERQLALVQQAKDDQRQREFERQQRLVRYQDALADADLQARRELQQIEQNKRRELQRLAVAANQELSLLNQKYVAELTGRRNAVQAELSIIGQGYSARLQQDANYVNALLAQGRLLQAGGLFGLFGTAAAPLLSSNRSAVNTNNFNITTGANPAQQQSLVTLIENVVARSFARIAQ